MPTSSPTLAAGPTVEDPPEAAPSPPRYRSLLSETLVYGVGVVATRFVWFLLMPVYTRLFPPQEYGLLDSLYTTSVLLFIVAELQIMSGVARDYYEAKAAGRLPVLLGTALSLYAINSALWVTVALGSFALLQPHLRVPVTWMHVLPVVVGVVPNQVFTLLQLILRFERLPRQFVLFAIFDVTTSAALSLVAVLVLHAGVAGVLWSLFISKVIWSSVLLYVRRGYYQAAFDRDYARDILTYGLPLVPSVLTKWGQNYANRYLIATLFALQEVGLFSVAIQLSAVIAVVDSAFRQAWDPYAMRMFQEEGSEPVFARTLTRYLAVMFGLCLLLTLGSSFAVTLVSGHRYAPAAPLIPFLAFGLMWNGASNILGAGNGWERRTYWNTLGFGAGVVVNLGLLWWALPKWGLPAAGITYLIGATLAAWVVLATAQRSHPIPYQVPLLGVMTIAAPLIATLNWWLVMGMPSVHLKASPLLLRAAMVAVTALVGFCVYRIERQPMRRHGTLC